jgi:hypothetical protein
MLLSLFRDYYILSRVNALLDKHFPGEPRPDLLELERSASLALHFGHPAIMDGLRPVAPNFVYVGMMNCRPPVALPKDLEDFMKTGKENGVIFVSFGSVLKVIRNDCLSLNRVKTTSDVYFRHLKCRNLIARCS